MFDYIYTSFNNFLNKHFGLFCSVVVLFAFRIYMSFQSRAPIEEYPDNKVVSVSTGEEWDKQKCSATLTIVDFYADWCPPCRKAAPTYGKMSTEYPDVVFLKVDVDKVPQAAKEFAVSAMPTFKLLLKGKEIASMVGFDEGKLRNFIVANTKKN